MKTAAEKTLEQIRTLKDTAQKSGGIALLNKSGQLPTGLLPEEALENGGNLLNITQQTPLPSGEFYTFETAISTILEKRRIKGLCITYESIAGQWAMKQFVGTGPKDWTSPSSWKDFGDGGDIKSIDILKGTQIKTLQPDRSGRVQLSIPTIDVDETLTQDGTNPVQGKAIVAALQNINPGKKLRLNTIESGGNKAFSISLLDEEDNELSTTEQFSSGNGSSVAATKIVLERITGSLTTKAGAEVKLKFRYAHIDTSTNSSTGTPAMAEISVTRGTNVNIIKMQLQAAVEESL